MNGYTCPRIHPYDRLLYRCQASIEEKRHKILKLTQARRENVPVPITTAAPTNAVSPQPAQPPPKITTKMTPLRRMEGPSSNIGENRTSVVNLTGNLQQQQQCPVQPAENKSHTVSESKSGEDLQNWDTLHDNRWSDTSSISEDLSVPGRWDPETGFWENFTDYKAWSDDSDVTTDDMQTSSEGAGVGISHSGPPSPTQVLPVKHPRPKYNERCRRWLWGECNLGYRCNFVHEDLEYDDAPVSF